MAVEPAASEVNSVSCLLLGLFANQSTAHLFYTADKEVLLDVIYRRLTDYGPGDQVCAIKMSHSFQLNNLVKPNLLVPQLNLYPRF